MSDFVKKKKYGQNFLTSDRIPARIAAESGITSGLRCAHKAAAFCC